MCFFTSQNKRAEELARRYGRGMDVVEAARLILAERELEEREMQERNPAHKTDIYAVRLNDGMFVSPAYAEPFSVIVSGSDQLRVMRWGLIPRSATAEMRARYAKRNLFKNARAENLFDTWPWKQVLHNRCIIPVTGFFEPHRFPDGRKQYFYIHRRDADLFSIAGLWDRWTDPAGGGQIETFVMITIAANEKLRWVHNGGNNPFRMPLIIPQEQVGTWLSPATRSREEIARFLKTPPDEDIVVWPVRRNFQQGDPYDPAIIKQVPPLEQDPGLF